MDGIPPNGPLKDRIAWILDTYPAARENYLIAQFYYWLEYDGLRQMLEPADHPVPDIADRFFWWYTTTARSPKTLLQRTQEVQKERPHLAPSPETQDHRKRQATAGPIN